ncbi:MAG TPA: acetate/propionate family kinase [Vicinamibacterales bacterium]|jgi:acetate kinase
MNKRLILSINGGSSSIKGALFDVDGDVRPLVRETMDSPGEAAAQRLLDRIFAHLDGRTLTGIGHRIVHGGPAYREPVVVNAGILEDLRRLIEFAPNHLPDEIALIESCARRYASVPQVACFDTAFHRTMPEVAARLPIPSVYDARGIRRYGFHGLSYAYLVEELQRVAGADSAHGRLILAHLGNGSSLAAVHHARSVDTTMAFTPMGGVVMSTRSGDLDPGVVTYLTRAAGLSAAEVEDVLSKASGLLGVSGTTGDMRSLLARSAQDAAAQLAVEMYAYSVRKAIGGFAAVLGGIDTLVFSGGIGEHAPSIRARICEGLACLGIEIDDERNEAGDGVISAAGARAIVRVIATDEEVMIARATSRALGSRQTHAG